MEEFACRNDQFPTLSTPTVPNTGEPDTVGPTWIVIAFPGPGIELVPAMRHSFLSARNSNLVIVSASAANVCTVTVTLEVAVPPGPVAAKV